MLKRKLLLRNAVASGRCCHVNLRLVSHCSKRKCLRWPRVQGELINLRYRIFFEKKIILNLRCLLHMQPSQILQRLRNWEIAQNKLLGTDLRNDKFWEGDLPFISVLYVKLPTISAKTLHILCHVRLLHLECKRFWIVRVLLISA
jgi:hypothetical protein